MPSQRRTTWLWVVVVIVALVLLAVAFYYYYYGSVPLPEGIGTPGGADELSAIERDLGALNLGGLDSELGDIEKELAR